MIIFLSFLIVSALVLWLVTAARGPWAVKLALIVFVPLFCFAIWHSLESYKGYPIDEGLPAKSIIISTIVVEPDHDQDGKIYLWLVPVSRENSLLGYRPGENEPRAYVLPYSRPLHEDIDGLRGKKGTAVLVRASREGKKGSRLHAYILPPTRPMKGG